MSCTDRTRQLNEKLQNSGKITFQPASTALVVSKALPPKVSFDALWIPGYSLPTANFGEVAEWSKAALC